jgi:hypothetical protein
MLIEGFKAGAQRLSVPPAEITNQPMSEKENIDLDAILPPSSLSLRDLVNRSVHYHILTARETQIVQNDLPRLEALNKELEESHDPDQIAIMKPGKVTLRPSTMPRNQQERWVGLQKYHTVLQKEPVSYEECVCLSVVSPSQII